ncbi:MAG: TonB-dependent receptor [Bacteroidetes bacterium]|nr:TonB-dependent receptor [Bacteroidota bacterium]
MFRILFLTLFSICAVCNGSYAQSFSVQGTIKDGQQNPIAFANIVLLNFSDSSFVQGTISDSSGYFSFQRIASPRYFLKVQYIGYETYYSEPFEKNAGTIQITLKASATTLGEVNVTATKPFIEQHLDKMVVNVENSPTSGGNNALELLEKSPGITVDHNTETIRILNKQGVIIYINGRQSYMSGTDLMQYLRTLQAEQISRIEIITNPSSKYDAAGNAGIINIVLKKDKSQGTNGNVVLGAGQGFLPDSRNDLFRGSLTASVNHRAKKFYFYSVASLLRDGSYSERNINRSFYYNTIESVFDQQMRINQNVENLNLKTGGDYFVSEKTTLGIGIDVNLFRLKVNGTNSTDAMMNPLIPDENFSIVQSAKQNNPRTNINTNFNLKHNFNNKGHSLIFDADYLNYNFRSEQNFDAAFFDAFNAPLNNLLQTGTNTSKLNVIAGKLDYELPLNEKTKLEFGTKSSYININSELDFKEMINNIWTPDNTKSNHFIYSENINALYGNFQKVISKFSVQFGLRAEHTYTEGKSVTLNNIVKRNYISLFPSLFTAYKINEKNTLKLSYSRRLDRPRYDQLNPFIIVLDPYSYATGNPYLQPQFTNAADLGYHYKTYSINFNYARTDKLITELTIPDDSTKITRTIETNLNYVDNFSTSIYVSQSIKKVWQINAQMILFYKHFSDNNLLGGQLNASRWMYYMNLTNNFTLPKKWGIELSAWYMSPFVEGIIVGKNHRFSVSAGIQKAVLKDKARIKLNMSDIFLTSFIDGYVDYQNVHLTFNPRHTSRRLMLTFSYNFGSQTIKTNQRTKSAADAEKERITK